MRLLVATRTGITAVDDGRAEDVWEGQARCLAREGPRAFAEKRKPNWANPQ